MIRGRIAIPDRDPKTWRSKGRKRKPQPAIASAIVTPAPMKKQRGSVDRSDDVTGPARSAIVEPKRKPTNAMHPHLLGHDGSEAEQGRRGDLADKLFRTIVRRAARSVTL